MRNIAAAVLYVVLVFASGCALMDMAAGIERDEQGRVTKANGGIAQALTEIMLASGGVGALVGGPLGYLIRAYRRKRIEDAGGRDDDMNGIPDPPKPAEPTKAV